MSDATATAGVQDRKRLIAALPGADEQSLRNVVLSGAIARVPMTGAPEANSSLEQDIIPDPADPKDQAAGDQLANREYLHARGI